MNIQKIYTDNNPDNPVFCRNIYLYNNRIMKMKKVEKYLNKIAKQASIEEKADSIKNFIKNIFGKK